MSRYERVRGKVIHIVWDRGGVWVGVNDGGGAVHGKQQGVYCLRGRFGVKDRVSPCDICREGWGCIRRRGLERG